MALQKQAIPINFAQGLDTKTDPYQVSIGKFVTLQNSVFDTAGRLTKRNGFPLLTNLPNQNQTILTTLNDNLLATGSNLYAFSQDTNTWSDQGTVQPVSLQTQSLVRNATNQSSPDTAIAVNGLTCLTYIDSGVCYYQISDSSTGQQIIPRTALTNGVASPRCFILGQYFIITFISTIGGGTHLQYLSIPISMPTSPNSILDASTTLTTANAAYDGYVSNNNLYLAWGDVGSVIKTAYLTSTLVLSIAVSQTASPATLISVTADASIAGGAIWVTWWDSASTNGFTKTYDHLLLPILAKTQVITATSIAELTSIAVNNLLTFFYEVNNTYTSPYPVTGVKTDYVERNTVTQTGTVGTAIVLDRSVGLASKSFFGQDGTIYVMVTYGEFNQPTYFLIDSNGNIIMKLAYSNGGGYETTQILPSVSYINSQYMVPYLIKDFLATVNKGTSLPDGTPTNSIYTQTGVNLAQFSINSSGQYSSEIADVLNLTGGQLWMYDGVKPVEQGFNVWPENVASTSAASGGALAPQKYYYVFTYEWTDNQGKLHRSAPSIPLLVDNTKTNEAAIFRAGFFSMGATTLTMTPTVAGVTTGQFLEDQTLGTALAPNTTVSSVSGATITLSTPTLTDAGDVHGDTIVASNPISFTATTTVGSNVIVVSSATGLMVGQTLIDVTTGGTFSPGLQTNSTITAISGTSVTISLPAIATTTASIITVDTIANTLYVPTLRLTYKEGNNPIRIVGYRWSAAQQVYYQFTSVTNPTFNDKTVDFVTIVDTSADISILGQTLLYTTGGVVENIGAPASIASALFKNRLFLVDAEDRNLLWYSKQVIEGVPVEMSDLFTLYVAPTSGAQGSTGPITALSAMDDKLIIFKKDAIYYLTGIGPDNTGASNDFSDPVFITANVGCANPSSIVLMPNGVMFQSDKGIWLLGRDLSTNYIGAPVEQFNNILVKSADGIPGTNQVRFILNDFKTTLVYDYFFQQWGTFTNLQAISACLYQGMHTYLNQFGSIYKETPNTWVDGSSPVLMSFTTSWIQTAGLQGFQRFYFLLLLGTYYTPFKLNVGMAYDYNQSPSQLINVQPDNYSPAWGGDASWGSGAQWGGPGNVFSARLFPTHQKCESFQLTVNEIYDSTFGANTGQGLTLSGLNIVAGVKKGYRTQSAGKSFG